MAATQPPNTQSPEETSGCIARSVANALAEDPSLEAVTINRARRTISVATLGRVDEGKISERITNSIEHAQSVPESQPCALLAGTGNCQSCATPLSLEEQRHIRI